VKEIIYSILFGIVAVAGIVWGIWYENFYGEEPKINSSEDTDFDDEEPDNSNPFEKEYDYLLKFV